MLNDQIKEERSRKLSNSDIFCNLSVIQRLINNLCTVFEEDNPRFNKETFLNATDIQDQFNESFELHLRDEDRAKQIGISIEKV